MLDGRMIRVVNLRKLAEIVGEDYFSSEDYMLDLYSADIAALPEMVNDLLRTKADAVAQPTSTEIVSRILKYCMDKRIPVIPRGHGTSGYGGVVPTRRGLVLEMTRMNEIHSIDKGKMTVEVGAGIIWGHLLEELEDEGLTVAAYPTSAPSSTVGGWVAAGGTGIGSTKYGGIREQVVDLEVVLPDGTVIRTAKDGKVIAQFLKGSDYVFNPGHDLYQFGFLEDERVNDNVTDLFVDSNGALGVITKVVLKIIPLRNLKPLVASFRSGQLMTHALENIVAATRPFFLHFITGDFYQMQAELGLAPKTSGEWIILATYEGTEDELAGEVEKFHHFVNRNNGIVESEEIAQHEWEERFYPMRIKRLGPSLAPSEVYVPLDNLEEFLEAVDQHFKNERYAIEGAVTNKGEVAALAWFLDDERKKISFLMGWYRSLDFIDIGLKKGGRAYSIGMWNAPLSRSFYGEKRLKTMYKVKRQTDSKNLMNPGKVFSGPLNLSFRFNLLILFAVTIAIPTVLFLAGLLVPEITNAYIPWLVPDTFSKLLWLIGLGLILGVVAIEVANMIPIGFVLTMGRPFMRLFRRIWRS